MFDDLKMALRYAWDLRGFLQRPLTPEAYRQQLQTQLKNRNAVFLQVVERAIFNNPGNPYLSLMKWAGVEFEDVAQLVAQRGLEGALLQLYQAGVYVTLDEFKGRQPIKRSGLHLPVTAKDFDSPLNNKHFEVRTGGTRSAGTRLLIDLDMLAYETAYIYFFLESFGLLNRKMAVWRPAPPASAGMKTVLRLARLGRSPEHWFTQNKLEFAPGGFKFFLFTLYAVYASRLWGKPLPAPQHVPLTHAVEVAHWLAEMKRQGTPAHIDLTASSGVRVCLAAKEHGLDISGTFFRFGGEPFTQAKAQVIENAGCRAVPNYSMAEIGRMGLACGSPAALDDVHLLHDKVALIQCERPVGGTGEIVQALFLTALHPSNPKLLLNLESGDSAVLEKRSCGCVFGELGYHWHLHDIRSYEKLTSGGMTFLGSTLIALIEEVLPARFGGHATDYQFVEDEVNGIPTVSLLINPDVGQVDEGQVVETVLSFLGSHSSGERMMAGYWADGQTLQVIRRQPYATSSAKIQTLHTIHKKGG